MPPPPGPRAARAKAEKAPGESFPSPGAAGPPDPRQIATRLPNPETDPLKHVGRNFARQERIESARPSYSRVENTIID